MGATRLDRGRHLRRCIHRKTQSYRYISTFLFAYCGVQHIMVFFVLFVFALCFAYPMSVFALNFFHLLARKKNCLFIQTNSFIFFTFYESSFACSGLQASGLVQRLLLWCPTHVVLCFLFVCLRLVLPVSLEYPFLIAPWVFSNVYFRCVLCTQCCQLLGISILLPLGSSLMFIFVLCLVYPMLPVSWNIHS